MIKYPGRESEGDSVVLTHNMAEAVAYMYTSLAHPPSLL